MKNINKLEDYEIRVLKNNLNKNGLPTGTHEELVDSCEKRLIQLLTNYPNLTITDALVMRMLLGADGFDKIVGGVPGWFVKEIEADGTVIFRFRRDPKRTCFKCLSKEDFVYGS